MVPTVLSLRSVVILCCVPQPAFSPQSLGVNSHHYALVGMSDRGLLTSPDSNYAKRRRKHLKLVNQLHALGYFILPSSSMDIR